VEPIRRTRKNTDHLFDDPPARLSVGTFRRMRLAGRRRLWRHRGSGFNLSLPADHARLRSSAWVSIIRSGGDFDSSRSYWLELVRIFFQDNSRQMTARLGAGLRKKLLKGGFDGGFGNLDPRRNFSVRQASEQESQNLLLLFVESSSPTGLRGG